MTSTSERSATVFEFFDVTSAANARATPPRLTHEPIRDLVLLGRRMLACEAKGQLAFSDRGRGSRTIRADDPLLPIAGVQQ